MNLKVPKHVIPFLEHLSIEFREKNKPKLSRRPIRRQVNTLKSQWELKGKVSKPSKARENVIFDWLRVVWVFLDQSQKQNKSKPMQSWITFEIQLKIALLVSFYVHISFPRIKNLEESKHSKPAWNRPWVIWRKVMGARGIFYGAVQNCD